MTTRRNLQPPATSPATAARAPALLELRHYATRPGRRDALIAMFETHFLDAYERAGAHILGTFRNLDAPDRWCWIRAFADLGAREAALQGFYGSDTWRTRSAACNATIADVSDARLLRPVRGRRLRMTPAPPADTAVAAGSLALVEALAFELRPDRAARFTGWFNGTLAPIMASAGAQPLAVLVTAQAAMADPRRPLRPGRYLVALSRFDSVAAHAAYRRDVAASPAANKARAEAMGYLQGPTEALRLQPTTRSALR